MWMIVCFLKSQCKNKVTNMADSKRNLPSSMEQEEGHAMTRNNDNSIFEKHSRDTVEKRPIDSLHVIDLKNRDIENPKSISIKIHQPFQCETHKAEDELDRFVYSGLKADKSASEGISKCLSAPILLPCPSKPYKCAVLKAEDPVLLTTTIHPDVVVSSIVDSGYQATTSCEPPWQTTTTALSDRTIFSNKDPAHLEVTERSCDMTGLLSLNAASILPADKCYSLGLKLNADTEINRKSSQKSHKNFNDETGQVRYFETHIELMGKMINDAYLVEGVMKQDISSPNKDGQPGKSEISKAIGKKSKTWTSFYDSENHLVHFQPETELEPKTPTDVLHRSKIDRTEETCQSHFSNEVQGECSNTTEDTFNINQGKYISSDNQSQMKYGDHLSDLLNIGDEQRGPSTVSQRQRAKNEQHQVLQHAKLVRERLWKYHRNCCDEYQPCQTASKVLKKIKALEKTQLMQKTKQSPPSDQDLLEENPLPPLLSSTFSEDHAMAKPAMFFTISCASSPNLSQYGNREVCASHHAPFLKDPIQASVNEDDNTAIVATSCAGHLDLPDTSVAFGEHLNNVSPFKLNLVALKDQPAVDVVEEKPRVDDRSVSNLALPTITAQKEVVRSKNINNLSASQLELPTICEPTLGAAVQKTSLENTRTRNVYLPVVGSHKIESVKSLPAIKILEGDNVKDNQYVEPEISSNKIITLTDPGFDGNPFFENQVSQFETQKTQIVSEPDVAIAAISSSTSNLVGMISNHGEVTTLEHESTHTQEPCKLTDFSTVSLDTEMHLTTSVSYANSTQDGEDVSDWPKIADLVKHSSTISLSSNFDILNPNLTTHFNTHYENLFYDSSKSNAELSVDLRDRPETMDNQPCDTDDHDNMVVEGLSFKCDVLHQYNSETDNTKGSNGMEYETFYIEDGTREHYKNPNDEKTRIRILDTQSKVTVQPDVKSQFLESAEKMPFEIENLEKIGDMHHNLDSHIINDNIVESTSYDDITQTFSVDIEVNSTANLQTSNEDHCHDQTEEVVYVNGQAVKHKGHHLTTPFKNRNSEEHKGHEDLSENLTRPPDVQTQTSEAEDPPSQANTSDLSTTVRLAAVEFKGYDDKSNERVNTNLGMMDINHDAENCDEILNIFQDILKSDSAAVSEKICSSPGSKAADLLDAETSSDALNTHYEKDDFRGIEYKLKENDCNSDESVNALRKAKVDLPNYITVCNSDATFNNGQVNRVGAMDASLCNTEIPLEDNQMLSDIQKIPKTYTKQACSNQKSKTNRPLKTTNKIPPANAKDKLYLKDFLSSRVYRRQFHSAFNFLANTLNTEEDEVVKNPTVEGEPSSSDLATARHCLMLSDMQPINKTTQAAEYLTYLYARSPKQKACPGSLEEVEVLGDIDDISVLANLHFCKVALPGEVGKREMSTDVQQVNADPKVEAADPDNVYIPPSKKELKADDELAVLHVICTLKRSLELSISNEMETD